MSVLIYENNEEDRKKLKARGWAHEDVIITEEHIKALQEGKCIGWDDGEYTHMIKLEKKEPTAEQFLKSISDMTNTCASCKFFEHGKEIGYCREYKGKTESTAPKCSRWRYFA